MTTTAETKVPALDEYWEKLASCLRPFSPEDKRAALALYRELAKGRAVAADQLARALGISSAETRAALQRDAIRAFIHLDDQGRVLGFGGLAAAPMHHCFEVEGQTLWTWCAWDSLFLPEILGRSARVTSPDPESGEIVRLVVTPDRIESVVPNGVVVSFIQPEAQVFDSSANVMAQFCHHVFFFASPESGERWIGKRPGAFLYSLDDAFALAKRLNARNFGPELARRARSPTLTARGRAGKS